MRNRPLSVLLVFVVGILSLLSGCATVPETGRKQLILMSAAEEAQMGVSAFAQIKKQEKISTDPAVNARIQRIGKRIAGAVGRDLPNAQWEFVVFESEQINAFALPAGKVGVYTGLIKLAGANDDEIAVVMGHEVAHVSSRHGAERQSQAALIGLGGVGLAAFAEGDECDGLADERVGLITGDSSGAAVGIDGTTKFRGVAVRGAEMTVTDGHLPGRSEPRRGIAASRRGGDQGRIAADPQVANRRRHLLDGRQRGTC
jgi:predicted Zn-dependent protease